VHFKVAILTVLATRPDGRVTLDELKDEVCALAAEADPSEEIASALDEVDIFQSGLVIPEDDGLRITDAGRSALKALAASNEPPLIDLPAASASPSLNMIDHLVGTEERLKIFDLELRAADSDAGPGRAEKARDAEHIENVASADTSPVAAQEADDGLVDEGMARPAARIGGANLQSRGPEEVVRNRPKRPAPAILVRDFESEASAPARAPPPRGRFGSAIAARFQQARSVWQRHLERDASSTKPVRRAANFGGGAIALLTLLVLVICAGAVVALTQIRSLKSEVATLQRELSPLRERAARAEFLEKAKQIADQQKDAQNSAAEKNKAGAAPRPEQAALTLTPEEIRQIRDFIKPAPATGTPAPAINVGDTVSIATLPLPSPLMEKIPKLVGARFTIRNGSIIILRRDSRQADVVLPPN